MFGCSLEMQGAVVICAAVLLDVIALRGHCANMCALRLRIERFFLCSAQISFLSLRAFLAMQDLDATRSELMVTSASCADVFLVADRAVSRISFGEQSLKS